MDWISKIISTTPPASMVCRSQKRPRAARRAPKMMPIRVAAMENITWKKMHELSMAKRTEETA